MAEPLLKIYIGKKTEKLIQQAARFSPKLAEKIRKAGNKAIKDVADLALKAYLSKVPIDTGELRGLGLGDGFIRRQYTSSTILIYVATGTHFGRDKQPLEATELARILNIGVSEKTGRQLLRTQKSAVINSAGLSSFGVEGRRTPTKDWEGKALRAFKRALPIYLNSMRLF